MYDSSKSLGEANLAQKCSKRTKGMQESCTNKDYINHNSYSPFYT